MSLDPPQFNVPLTTPTGLTTEGYALLQGFYEALEAQTAENAVLVAQIAALDARVTALEP